MGMGLYGGEKIKRLTKEREREKSEFLRITTITKLLAPFNGGYYT